MTTRFSSLQVLDDVPTSFPRSLFSASIVVETMEAEKRDPGNEVDDVLGKR